MDKLAAMRAFVAIAEHGSLSAAAAALDRAPPTMVRTLAALEAELGTRLLTRTTRSQSLTEAGRTYLERCRQILADVDDAEQAVSSTLTEPRGAVRLTAPVRFGELHVTPPVCEFAARYREVHVDLLLLDRVVDLVEEGIDLAVRIGELGDAAIVAIPVGQMRRVVVASPGCLAEAGTPAHPHDLAGKPCVTFRGLTAGAQWHFVDSGRRTSVAVNGRLTCNHASAALEACAAGLGFGSFLAYQVTRAVREGELCIVLEDYEPPPLPVSLVYPDPRVMSARLRLLADFLRDALRASSGSW